MLTIRAANYHRGRLSPIRLIVIHSMEAPEKGDTAEAVARYFARRSTKASAHICADNNSLVRCVPDRDTAWAAPGANSDGLQLELAGYARQSRADWTDTYSRALLDQAARQCATWARSYRIPIRKLSRTELRAGRRGFTSHADVSLVYRRSDHTDPGRGFPWDRLLNLTAELADDGQGDEEVKVPTWQGSRLGPGSEGDQVRIWQRRMRARGWDLAVDGRFDAGIDGSICRKFQREKRLTATGVVDEATWRAAWTAPIT
ncbi:N-acetylmuramoyl-L-alanine amidase [Nonomuraea sp. NPDC059023]|uniref:peptidoglycan recognition protein family protein n=1 Tax=unclassified Nonomuraea TaxID=2593643 RepID=UPI0036ABD6F1